MAQVVEIFKLPDRKLPATAGDVLAISDGPSLDDYSVEDIHHSGAVLCGYGRSAARIHYDHYWIWDLSFLEILVTATPMRVYACPPVFEAREHAPQHDWVLASPDCTFHVAVESRRMFRDRRQFVLGVDGYIRLDGVLRAAQYPVWLPETERTRSAGSYTNLQSYDNPSTRQQQNNCTALYLIEEFQQPAETWNLSLESAYTPIWPAHPAVSAQAFGLIDRRGSAVVVDTTGNYPVSELSGWSVQPHRLHEHYIWGLRRECPQLAIFVRAVSPELLAPRLPSDIQVAGIDAEFASSCRFSRVDVIYLPPIAQY